MGILTLVMALAISGVAAWYSIVGLIAIFSGAAIPIAIMGGVLEVGKLVTAAWLHANWNKVPLLMKSYLTTSVFILMVITSLGIFGFLSKAHLEHSISTSGTNELQITNLERQIARQQSIIADAETVLTQLDQQVSVLIEYDRIRGPSGSIAVREEQSEERSLLNKTIDAAYIRIDGLQKDLAPLQQEKLAIEVEVGPLKYIAELIYGDEASDHFDAAVRWVIILLVVVFDPLAVTLLLAANLTLAAPKKPTRTIEAATVSTMEDDWNFVEVEVNEDPSDQEPDVSWITSEHELRQMLETVDKKLLDLYTNSNTLDHKHEKRSLQRLKKKILMKLDNNV